MAPDFHQDHFQLFGLAPRFGIDTQVLDAAWRALQAQVHPDRHAHLPESERRVAMQWATRVNEAHAALRHPLRRAEYLLGLAGVDLAAERNTAMAPEFLMEQMEWREAVEMAHDGRDINTLDALHQRVKRRMGDAIDDLQRLLDERKAHALAADQTRRLMFLERLLTDIDQALAELEDSA